MHLQGHLKERHSTEDVEHMLMQPNPWKECICRVTSSHLAKHYYNICKWQRYVSVASIYQAQEEDFCILDLTLTAS